MMADVKREARGCRIDARASHATRPVPRTHLEVTDTLPATRAADMVMADMFVWGCGRVAARSGAGMHHWHGALRLFIDKKISDLFFRRSRTERRVIKPPTRRFGESQSEARLRLSQLRERSPENPSRVGFGNPPSARDRGFRGRLKGKRERKSTANAFLFDPETESESHARPRARQVS